MARRNGLAALFPLLFHSVASFGAVSVAPEGLWPNSWPKELNAYRHSAITLGVRHGIQERIYAIPFTTREDFEAAWPHILALKSPGAPIILEKSPAVIYGTTDLAGTMAAGVRMLCPSTGNRSIRPDGAQLTVGPPWPKEIENERGELPEYVTSVGDSWVPWSPKSHGPTRRYRARVDIVLMVDGDIVDLDRIQLPPDTPIIDKRFLKKPGERIEGGGNGGSK